MSWWLDPYVGCPMRRGVQHTAQKAGEPLFELVSLQVHIAASAFLAGPRDP